MHIGNDSHARACAVMQLAARFDPPRGLQRLFVPSLFCHFKMRKPLVLKQTHLNAKYMRKCVFKTHLARLARIKILPAQSWPHQPHLLQTQASAESGRSLYTWLTDPYLAFLSFLDFLSLDLFLLGLGFLGSGLSSSVEAGLRLAALFGSASTDFW